MRKVGKVREGQEKREENWRRIKVRCMPIISWRGSIKAGDVYWKGIILDGGLHWKVIILSHGF